MTCPVSRDLARYEAQQDREAAEAARDERVIDIARELLPLPQRAEVDGGEVTWCGDGRAEVTFVVTIPVDF